MLKDKIDNTVFVLSSGFLIYKKRVEILKKHINAIKQYGKSILLLPSKSLMECTEIIVRRQVKRGFNLNRKREMQKVIERFPLYIQYGDIQIFSQMSPEQIADKMYMALKNRRYIN